jgi:prepilin-type N-terminal cleavage/methylation domain-containing protein
MRRIRQAFTLIELLTVMAITTILLGIITVPIVQSFNLTRSAQGYSDAQDKARLVIEQITRSIANAAGVRDNSGIKGSVAIRVPAEPALSDPYAGGAARDAVVLVPYAKLDLVEPAQGEPEKDINGNFIFRNDRGDIDPTINSPRGQVVLPVAPGQTIRRYWIGLRDPLAKYSNPYDGLLMTRASGRDNLFVVYEAEVQPYAYGSPSGNASLFTVDGTGSITDFDDPGFFTANVDANGAIITGDAKATRIRNWKAKARVLTEVSRYDMVLPVYDKASRKVTYDLISTSPTVYGPRLVPLIQFRPTRVSNEPAEAMQAGRLGEETDGATQVGSEVFSTQYGGWTASVIRTWPSGWTQGGANEYLVGRLNPLNGRTGIFAYDPDASGDDVSTGTELFDLTAYESATSGGSLYPFTFAVNQANTRSGWTSNLALRNLFEAYSVDPGRGKIVASFGISEVGTNNPNPNTNIPTVESGDALSPLQSTGAGAAYAGSSYRINDCFNRVWNENNNLRPDVQRYIDLRVTDQPDGTPSPLHPDPLVGLSRARLVLGSEVLVGPDQLPGPNYGRPIRYTRVARRNPGPNQYFINYVNQAEPDYAVAFPGYPTPPANYDPNNFMSAVIQARFKAGYIQLNSDPNVPLPQGTFTVSYRFQFTGQNGTGTKDVFAVDYDSRQLLSVLLTIRNYPQTSLPNPATVTLKGSAAVRNYLR